MAKDVFYFQTEYSLPMYGASDTAFMSFMEAPSSEKLVPYLVKTKEEARPFTDEQDIKKILAEACLHPLIFKVQGAHEVSLKVVSGDEVLSRTFATLTINCGDDLQMGCVQPIR